MEAEANSESTKNHLFTPFGFKLDPRANFDRFVKTVSGKDTLHDTVGIDYQTVTNNGSNKTEHNNTRNSV